jgi:hypothetical protein
MRRLLAIAFLLLTACSTSSKIEVKGVEIAGVKGAEYPSEAVLCVGVDNRAGAFTIRQCRLRFGIEGRRQVVVSLTERVKVGRGAQSVNLPIKINVVHNSLTMRLREMLSRGEVSAIEVDGEYQVRRGWLSRRGQIPPTPITELLSKEELEQLWNMIEENKKQ